MLKKRKYTRRSPAPQTGFITGEKYSSGSVNISGGDIHKTLEGASSCCFGSGGDDPDLCIFEVHIVAVHKRNVGTVREPVTGNLKLLD